MKDIVTYELAVKLKEKGFNWICSHYYRTKCKDLFKIFPCEDWSDIKDRINAPTISQVLKWLREDKDIHIIVEIADSGWYYTLYPNVRWEDGKLKSDKYIMSFKNKNSYEEAALAGIEYVLDKLI
jgi:hypothetical protein